MFNYIKKKKNKQLTNVGGTPPIGDRSETTADGTAGYKGESAV